MLFALSRAICLSVYDMCVVYGQVGKEYQKVNTVRGLTNNQRNRPYEQITPMDACCLLPDMDRNCARVLVVSV
jgi:hypothetical protein